MFPVKYLRQVGLPIFILTAVFSCGTDSGRKVPKSIVSQSPQKTSVRVMIGAENLIERNLGLIKGKKIALVAHPASLVFGSVHLADTLLGLGIELKKVFAPEHGFRGEGEAGEFIENSKDKKTGLPVVSLYGNKFKPKKEDLAGIEAVVLDLQDVGVRYYTYISTLTYVMQACAEAHIPMIVTDRPNPNAGYVAGFVMNKKHTSFVGMHCVPLVYGMTIGEYALMVNGENWNPMPCDLKIIPCENYRRSLKWSETDLKWVPPSPNLPTVKSAELYPFLGWYESTIVSVGRGTDFPFETVGFPLHQGAEKQWKIDSVTGQKTLLTLEGLKAEAVRFTPRSIPGKAADPPYKNRLCWGFRLTEFPEGGEERFRAGLALLQNMYREYYAYFSNRDRTPPEPFFTPPGYYPRLFGTEEIETHLRQQRSPEEMAALARNQCRNFLPVRKKYLKYGG